MKYSLPFLTKSLALGLIASSLFTSQPALAQTLPDFAFGEERVRFDLTTMTEDQLLNTVPGWTGVTNSALVTGTTPRKHAAGSGVYTPGPIVAGTPTTSTNKATLNSPTVSPSTPFTGADTMYFSAVINLYGSSSSGVRVMVGDYGGAGGSYRGLVGFGAAPDSTIGRLQVYNGSSVIDVPHTGEGAVTLLSGNWYELTLVVQQNQADPANSLGYLFYRNLSVDGALTLVDTPQSNGFTIDLSGRDLSDFDLFRLSEFRYGAQVASLSAGVGVISIPEPSAMMMGGATVAALCSLSFLNQRRRKTVSDNQ